MAIPFHEIFKLPIYDHFEYISRGGHVYAIDGVMLEEIISGYAMVEHLRAWAGTHHIQKEMSRNSFDSRKRDLYRRFFGMLAKDKLKTAHGTLHKYLWIKRNGIRAHVIEMWRGTQLHKESMSILDRLLIKSGVDAVTAVVSIAVVVTGVGGAALVAATVVIAGVSASSEYFLAGSDLKTSVVTGGVNLIPLASEINCVKNAGNVGKVLYVSADVVANGGLEYHSSESMEQACEAAVTSAFFNVKGNLNSTRISADQLKSLEKRCVAAGSVSKEAMLLTSIPNRNKNNRFFSRRGAARSYITPGERQAMWTDVAGVVREVSLKKAARIRKPD